MDSTSRGQVTPIPRLAEGHTALVTGGGSGIGRATAELFAKEGARVVVVDANADAGEETREGIQAGGGEAIFVQADVGDEAAVEHAVARAVEAYGRLDSAFNNAGVTDAVSSLHEVSLESWEHVIRVNLTGVFLCMKHEIIQMLRQEKIDGRRGAIVNTSSGAGFIAAPGLPHYTASKHGVLGIVKNAAQEYYQEGIRVNAVCPGITATPMITATMVGDSEFVERMRAALPGGEPGRPDDIAQAAVWLCSWRARWVNGEPMLIDGGTVAR
jgi:NAD(P)-dependent dehydrogenase (short-subunit alcohol dehydrogenase family)